MPLRHKPTPEAKAAAAMFNTATGWYAAEAVGNRVVITIDPAKCTALTNRYIGMNPETTS